MSTSRPVISCASPSEFWDVYYKNTGPLRDLYYCNYVCWNWLWAVSQK